MKLFLIALVACFLVAGLLGCAAGRGPSLPDIRLQPPLLFELGDQSVPGPRLQPRTYYEAPTYSPVNVPGVSTAPCR